MDPLDHLAGPGSDLLRRVDDLLAAAGAPDDHWIWPLLRRLGTLPGDALGEVVALRPAPLAAAGHAVRTLVREYDHARADLTGGDPWQGAGAQAYAAHRDALAAYLDGDPESLTGRLEATAAYADAVDDWVAQSRHALARTLADVLGSAEAVAVVTGTDSGTVALAAAEIGARVLATVTEAEARGTALLHQWAPDLTELPYRGPVDPGPTRLDATTWISG
ncbi:hypothetical protein [Micromonospora sp. NBC_01796]|uniref:hypothetical protein n=1 Tax=Micromonospora sp. NBC_01796 TaxID=2975987 RepID=UPI002DDBED8B|nr:hypothetical protein [Micromonospora sp. NBC_01796]WSA88050.1 hypothetical protein OIE47_10800 [Micromonospora sp. NBC_01796]